HMQLKNLYGRYLSRLLRESPRYPAHLLGLVKSPPFLLGPLGGYPHLRDSVDAQTREVKTAITRKMLQPGVEHFRVSTRAAGLMQECVRFCRHHGVKVGVVL